MSWQRHGFTSPKLSLFIHPKPWRRVCGLDCKLKRVNVDKSTWGLLKIICSRPDCPWTHGSVNASWAAWLCFCTHLYGRVNIRLCGMKPNTSSALTWNLSIIPVGRKCYNRYCNITWSPLAMLYCHENRFSFIFSSTSWFHFKVVHMSKNDVR